MLQKVAKPIKMPNPMLSKKNCIIVFIGELLFFYEVLNQIVKSNRHSYKNTNNG
jgi:hypothetical protein